MEGVQHNTYDVEFYGPNPMCGIYYLGALRAGEEMARAAGDEASAQTYRSSSNREAAGSTPISSTASFTSRRCADSRKDEIANNLRSDMGSENTLTPEYQLGDGLPGGPACRAIPGGHLRIGSRWYRRTTSAPTLRSIYRYNYKRSLAAARQCAAHLCAER